MELVRYIPTLHFVDDNVCRYDKRSSRDGKVLRVTPARVHGLDRNMDDLNAVIRSLSPYIRPVIVVRVLRRHDGAWLYLI